MTQDVGRGVIDAALAGGHRITLFNRGRTHPELYPQVEKLRGDRDGGLAALDGRRWDAVIDTCGYVPRVVRQSAQRLRDCADAYLFISSISVYADLVGAREDSPRHVLEDRTVEDVTGATYGGLKALCEDAVVEAFGARAVIVRPGLIVGAHDGTYRFPWWVGRVAAGGEVLYPAQGRIQLIDAGLTYRPLADTVRDTRAWLRDHPAPQMPPGISREREAELIAALRGGAGGVSA